ncbi:MAG: branched-chain-amino-acid transaminase [Spirochaetales bacterium]|nr:branched-chain-amino-acid transaminase [Spirochaetales bacterium]
MAGFTLKTYPCVYIAKYDGQNWEGESIFNPHKSPEEEAQLSEKDSELLFNKRNNFLDLPLINYTTQYGLGCFEGLKAFPQKDGSFKIFRPDENAKRFKNSMEGLKMPGCPEELFLDGLKDFMVKNIELGFFPKYDENWEKDKYLSGHSIYVRPFSYSEAAIGLGLSKKPWVIMVATEVGAYFSSTSSKAVTTNKIRATKNGTGWIKCNANYVIPTLAKKEAEAEGYMEAIFLDHESQKYVEEGSSCNIFFRLKDNTLVTPALGETILPGITRKSIIQLAKDEGIKVEERKISIKEAMNEAKEVFVSGTAAGLTHIGSITHNGKTAKFGDEKIGELSLHLLEQLKGIQYGAIEDKHNWMFKL